MSKIYISYSTKDKDLYDQLIQHLSPLQNYHKIKIYQDKDIQVGDDWQEKLNSFIEEADIYLILLSSSFLASDYCNHELNNILNYVVNEGRRIVPVILKPCDWTSVLGKYFALPKHAIPVTSDKWLSTDDAFNNISTELQRLFQEPEVLLVNNSVKKIYISYALKDSNFRNELYKHLFVFERTGLIKIWDDRKILPGDDWDAKIMKNIADSDVYISIVTSNYISSNYIVERELQMMNEKARLEGRPLIPLLLRSCNWKATLLSEYQPLPNEGYFITDKIQEEEVEKEIIHASIEIVLAAFLTSTEDLSLDIKSELRRLETMKLSLIDQSIDSLEINSRSNKVGTNKTVFISYNHKDIKTASRLKKDLEENNIEVIIDNKMWIGDDIKRFIEESVYNSDYTISIVSINSLLSSWVAMESINTFYKEKGTNNNNFIGCYIDDSFFDRDFPDKVIDFLDSELHSISQLIPKRLERNAGIEDLQSELKRIRDFKHQIDSIISRLRNSKCLDISEKFYESNIGNLIEVIKKN